MSDIRDRVSSNEADIVLRDYHDARRREEQWRIPQILLAIVAPILALITVVEDLLGRPGVTAVGGLTVVCATAAALLAIQVWRWHRIATSHLNQFRTDYPNEASLLLKDPI